MEAWDNIDNMAIFKITRNCSTEVQTDMDPTIPQVARVHQWSPDTPDLPRQLLCHQGTGYRRWKGTHRFCGHRLWPWKTASCLMPNVSKCVDGCKWCHSNKVKASGRNQVVVFQELSHALNIQAKLVPTDYSRRLRYVLQNACSLLATKITSKQLQIGALQKRSFCSQALKFHDYVS